MIKCLLQICCQWDLQLERRHDSRNKGLFTRGQGEKDSLVPYRGLSDIRGPYFIFIRVCVSTKEKQNKHNAKANQVYVAGPHSE